MTPADDVVEAARRVGLQLRECGISFALGGALAYNYYGVPRATGDIDFNVFVPAGEAAGVFRCLSGLGIQRPDEGELARIEREGQARTRWQDLWVDLFFAYAPFHDSCRARAIERPFSGERFPVLSAEDLVVFKVLFNRTRDWGDIERILEVQGERFDIAYALHWLDDILGPEDSARTRLAAMHAEALDRE
jgi:hypothetical protein